MEKNELGQSSGSLHYSFPNFGVLGTGLMKDRVKGERRPGSDQKQAAFQEGASCK